jgi:hypothetical protein
MHWLWAGVLGCGLGWAAGPVLLEPANGALSQPSDVVLTWQAATPASLLTNGGFESGSASWNLGFGWMVTGAAGAYEGSRYIEMPIQYSNRLPGGESWFLQQTKLPARGAAATLTWMDHTTADPSHRARLHVEVSTTTSLQIVHDAFLGDNTGLPWGPQQADLTAFLGRTITVAFVFTNRTPDRCYAAIDAIRLEVTPADLSYEVYVGKRATLGAADLVGTAFDTSYWLGGLVPGSTNYWKVTQIADGIRSTSPVFSFVVADSHVEPPVLRLEPVDGGARLRFATQPGVTYVVEDSETLDAASWQPTGDVVYGDGSEAAVEVAFFGTARFLRVQALP